MFPSGTTRPRETERCTRLLRLQRTGLVTAGWREGDAGPARKYYRLTPAGAETLHHAAASGTASPGTYAIDHTDGSYLTRGIATGSASSPCCWSWWRWAPPCGCGDAHTCG